MSQESQRLSSLKSKPLTPLVNNTGEIVNQESSSYGSHGTYAHRPIVWGTNGMVGGGTQLTAQAGLRTLREGGNAVDAAVASALAAGVLEPTAHYTLGGEVAMLTYDASSGRVHSVVGQGWAPQAATIELYEERWGEIPAGVHSTTVPGVISALLTMLAEHGTMSFGQVATDAFRLAADGFPAYQLFCNALSTPERIANLSRYPDSARVFLPDGHPPSLGSIFKQPDLARTLSLMVEAEKQAIGHRDREEQDQQQVERPAMDRGHARLTDLPAPPTRSRRNGWRKAGMAASLTCVTCEGSNPAASTRAIRGAAREVP